MQTCTKCEQPKDDSEFWTKGNRLQYVCKDCQKAYHKEHYEQNKARYVANAKKRNKRIYKDLYGKLALLKAKPCTDCGRCYPPYVMDFDHRVSGDKVAGISYLLRSGKWAPVLREIKKCDLVCANCHRERTHQRLQGLA